MTRSISTSNTRPGAPRAASASRSNHHLWRNGRLWWLAATVHLPGWRKERIRVSLGTDDPALARRRRDACLADLAAFPGCVPSLRFSRRRPARRPEGR